jgi:hypothetical protein
MRDDYPQHKRLVITWSSADKVFVLQTLTNQVTRNLRYPCITKQSPSGTRETYLVPQILVRLGLMQCMLLMGLRLQAADTGGTSLKPTAWSLQQTSHHMSNHTLHILRGQLLLANTPQLPHSDQGNFSCQTTLAPMLVPKPVPGSELDRGATRTSTENRMCHLQNWSKPDITFL